MKLLTLLTFLIMSFSSFADQFATIDAADPRYCGNKSSCVKGYIPVVRSGKYYARGIGANCDQAMARAENAFVRAHGNIDDCGLISGPSLDGWSCRRRNGQTVAWMTCNPDSGSDSDARTQRRSCVLGGVWICGR